MWLKLTAYLLLVYSGILQQYWVLSLDELTTILMYKNTFSFPLGIRTTFGNISFV
jgi:hypothetical protein